MKPKLEQKWGNELSENIRIVQSKSVHSLSDTMLEATASHHSLHTPARHRFTVRYLSILLHKHVFVHTYFHIKCNL
jgi:hypothetical protein